MPKGDQKRRVQHADALSTAKLEAQGNQKWRAYYVLAISATERTGLCAPHTHKKSQAGPDKPAPTNTKTKYGVHKTYLPLLTYGLTLTSPPTTTAIHLSRLAQTFREKSKSDSQKVYAALRPPAMHVDRSARRKIQARRRSRYRSRLSPTRDWKKKAPSAGPRYVRDASSQEAISPTRVSHPVAPTRTPSAF